VSNKTLLDRTNDVVDRLSLGMLVLIPACLIVACIIVLGGPYVGTGMVIAPVLLGSAWVIGDLTIDLISKEPS
jgi:hypothetical protein